MAFDIPPEPPEPEDVKTYLDWLNSDREDYESVYRDTLSEGLLFHTWDLPKTIKDRKFYKDEIDEVGYAVFRASDGQIWVIKKIDYDINIFFRSKKSINRSRSPKKNKKSARKRKSCSTRKTSKRKPRRV